LEKGGKGGFKRGNAALQQESDKEVFKNTWVFLKNMRVFVILKISLNPSFPKRGFRVSTEKSEEPKVKSYKLSRFL